jgi:hypothetical protein
MYYRYLNHIDTLFEQVVEDMDRDSFAVSDKYKGKYEELGKILSLRAYFLFFSFSIILTIFSHKIIHFSQFLPKFINMPIQRIITKMCVDV